MEDKRGTKRSRSPSKEGSSSSSSSASTPLPSPYDSVPPPVSPPEGSPCRSPSPVHEHGGPSETIPVVDLSSDEEEIFPDTMRDEEFIRRLFSKLNRKLLGPLGDDNIIILSDSDEKEEVHEEITVDAEAAPPSAMNSPAPSVSIAAADDAPDGVQDDNSDGGDKVGSP
jgi:hypothetical protein